MKKVSKAWTFCREIHIMAMVDEASYEIKVRLYTLEDDQLLWEVEQPTIPTFKIPLYRRLH